MSSQTLLSTLVQTHYNKAQDLKYVMEFPFGGINSFEPGRWGDIHCYNDINRQAVKDFVESTGLDVAKAVREPRSYVADVKKALNSQYGNLVEENEGKHHEKYRFVDGIASYISYTLLHVEQVIQALESGKMDDNHKFYVDAMPTPTETTRKFKAPSIVDEMSQVISENLIAKGRRVLQVVAASAFGTFGDPTYACTSQEENLFRSMPLYGRLDTQFFKSNYVEEVEKKNGKDDNVSCFRYKDEFAPKGGKCVLIHEVTTPDINFPFSLFYSQKSTVQRIYFLVAAPNNKKNNLTDQDQRAGYRDLFPLLYKTASNYNADIVGGASGLGIFNCNVDNYCEVLNETRKNFEGSGEDTLSHTIAYFRPNKKDEKSLASYNTIENTLRNETL